MMPQQKSQIPAQQVYGVLKKDNWCDPIDHADDQLRRLGYAIVESGFTAAEIAQISQEFDETRTRYTAQWGAEHLTAIDEHNSIRLPMALSPRPFRKLAFNGTVLSLVGKLIEGQFILNQQNGVINPAGQRYNQGFWHRDLPYQHYLSSVPLAINALYCVDDFTSENGGTWVLPATHKTAEYPSDDYVSRNAMQVHAKAGQYIVLDCMAYHTGGSNMSTADRRAVNHVYTIPYIKQQIRIPGNVDETGLDAQQKRLLGIGMTTPQTVAEYLAGRAR